MAAMKRLPVAVLRSWEKYFAERDLGRSPEAAARKANFSASTAYRFERGDQTSQGIIAADILGVTIVAGNRISAPLVPEAVEALADFAKFRLRYMGRRSSPWQERAAYDVLRALQSDKREYLVINAPPGFGKSTLFTHDIPCWIIAQDRGVRIMLGARTQAQANAYLLRIKRTLERDAPMRASGEDLENGVAWDAVACMADDFGSFKPEGKRERWAANALVVRTLDGVAPDDKEATVSAWGNDSGFLGGRFDLVIWDDLVDKKNIKTADARDAIREWWTTEAETRLEPKGCMILQGQRMAGNDLYRFALDMTMMDETPKYRRIVYQAHDESKCDLVRHDDPDHPPPAWPDGCMLDPDRMTWAEMQAVQRNTPRVWSVQYQQEDGDLVGGLIDPAWLVGGIDDDGYLRPGCYDKDRSCGQISPEIAARGWSFVTCDPSPDNWWGIIWWVYDPLSGRRYVIDIYRRKMDPQDWIDYDIEAGLRGEPWARQYTGLLEDIRVAGNALGAPLHTVIVEVNGWQKYLNKQTHMQRWLAGTKIEAVGHQTHINKNDPQWGLESIGSLFQQGMIRLPFKAPSDRTKVGWITTEAKAYPDGDTTDLLMSIWFGKLGVEHTYVPRKKQAYTMARPGYMKNRLRGLPSAYVAS